MSIATKRGDGGQTALPGGVRVSKTHPRVECYGTIDELISSMGLARALTNDAEVNEWTRGIQRELFKVGSAIGTMPDSRKPAPEITAEMVAALDREVERIEAIPGLMNDWTVPEELADSAAFDVARTVCRKTERLAVGLFEAGELTNRTHPGIFESPVGCVVADWPRAGVAGRRGRRASPQRSARRAMVAGVVTGMARPSELFRPPGTAGRLSRHLRAPRYPFAVIADPVPDAVLGRLLDAAHHGPSVGFMQPWDFIVIRESGAAVRSTSALSKPIGRPLRLHREAAHARTTA